jgi:transposase-like protein
MHDLPNPKIKKRRSTEEWRALVAGFAESDLSLAKYCEAHGIAASGFYTWRKRFEEEAVAESSPFIEVLTPEGSDTPLSSRTLADWRLELSLGDGVVLRIR